MGILPYMVRGCDGWLLGNNLSIDVENNSPFLTDRASSYMSMGMSTISNLTSVIPPHCWQEASPCIFSCFGYKGTNNLLYIQGICNKLSSSEQFVPPITQEWGSRISLQLARVNDFCDMKLVLLIELSCHLHVILCLEDEKCIKNCYCHRESLKCWWYWNS